MKSIVFAALLLVATATASDLEQKRDPTPVIRDFIENWKQSIKDRNLDPYQLGKAEWEYVLIDPSILQVNAFVETLRVTGLSNIAVRQLRYYNNEIIFWIEYPQVMATLGNAGATISVAGREVEVKFSGLLAINGLGATGRVRLIDGANTSVEVINVSGYLRSIDSYIRTLQIGNFEASAFVNSWLRALPENLKMYEDLINKGMAAAIEIGVNRILSRSI